MKARPALVNQTVFFLLLFATKRLLCLICYLNEEEELVTSPSQHYQLLDSGNFRKLEQVGSYRIVRPSASAIWKPSLKRDEWQKCHAEFVRKGGGDGQWKMGRLRPSLPESWSIQVDQLTIVIKPTDFGHLGFFAEHHEWQDLEAVVKSYHRTGKPFRLLNLFAYTGVTSLMAASLGAQVTHVDASKSSVAWARENAELSGLGNAPIRWIVDDVQKYLSREIKRKSLYQGIILDPPSYGRGPKGEVWKIEEHLWQLLDQVKAVAADDFCYLQLSAHSPGITPLGLKNCIEDLFGSQSAEFKPYEMTVEDKKGRLLPSGVCCKFFNI